MQSSKTFLFFGVVGAGKGTQVELLQEFLRKEKNTESIYLYPGSEFRSLVSGDSYTGEQVRDRLEAGHLQPNFLTDTLTVRKLVDNYTGNEAVIFDGYPRTTHQSGVFEEIVKFYGWQDVTIVFIELSKEEAITRLTKRGRSDDTEAGIAKRFDEYVNNVMPALEVLKQNNPNFKTVEINGEQTVEAVHQEILSKLGYV